MHLTTVRSDLCVPLGEDARRLGFLPGVPVRVSIQSTGSLLIRIDDEPVLIEAAPRPLGAGTTRKALGDRRAS